MNVRPLSDRILVRRVDADEQVKGALSSPILLKKHHRKQRSLPLDRANAIRMEM